MVSGIDTNPYVLSSKESNMIREIFKHYLPKGKALGLEKIYNQIETYLSTSYFQNPVKSGTRSLPIFKTPILSQVEKEAYYRHTHHTAGRYLLALRGKANPWIHPNVEFAQRVSNGKTACITEKSKHLIALLWLLANDDTLSPLPKANRLEAFAAVIADIARAKNWNQCRINRYGEREEYDNMQPDLPSCAQGVDKRLIKLVNNIQHEFAGNPILRELNAGVLKHAFYERVVNPFIKEYIGNLSLEQCKALQRGIRNKFLEEPLTEEEFVLIYRFKIDQNTIDGWGKIDQFMEWAENFFTEERIKAKHPYSWQDKTYPDVHTLIYHEFSKNLWNNYFEQLDAILSAEIALCQKQSTLIFTLEDDPFSPFRECEDHEHTPCVDDDVMPTAPSALIRYRRHSN